MKFDMKCNYHGPSTTAIMKCSASFILWLKTSACQSFEWDHLKTLTNSLNSTPEMTLLNQGVLEGPWSVSDDVYLMIWVYQSLRISTINREYFGTNGQDPIYFKKTWGKREISKMNLPHFIGAFIFVAQAAACLTSSSAPSNLISYEMPIPVQHCKLTNCHNCARAINNNFGGKQSKIICSAMYHQPGCCDFYIKRSKGILFWKWPVFNLNETVIH